MSERPDSPEAMRRDGPARPTRCDVLVVGGGPAGATIATLLRQRGHDVLLLEKDRHPRFHIGESLLPRNLPIFRRLGLADRLAEIGVVKRGADFNLTDDGAGAADPGHVVFDFADALAPDEPSAFQVLREDLDAMLFDNAERAGVRAHQETRLVDVALADDGVRATARDADGAEIAIQADFLVDASGRDSFLARKMDLRRRDPNHASAAVFSHFDGVTPRPGEEAGNISIYWFDHGWFWVIPLHDGCTSVGMVCYPAYLKDRPDTMEALFHATVAGTPGLAERMAGARSRRPIQGTGNFSYRSARMTGERYLLVGDAYAFIDPVFSSGVFLAMQGAEFAAEAVDGCLREPAKAARHRRRFERRVRGGLKTFSWFIYRFTNPGFRYLFSHPTDRFAMRRAIISVLSGDVYGRTRLWPQLLAFRALYHAANLVHWKQGARYRRRLATRDPAIT